MEKVRLGIIGVGNMGSGVLKELDAGNCPEIVVTAICDCAEDRQKWAEEKYAENGVKIFADVDDLLNSGICDAVYIATPHYDHPVIAKKAFAKKLHVLTEKPAGVYTKAVREMNEAAKAAGVKFGICFQNRTTPAYKKAKELLESGVFGQIRSVTWLITTWYRNQAYYDSGSWRATWAGEGGGVLINQCPHNLDLLQWICGMPDEVYAKCSVAQWHDVEIEDDVVAVLKYKNGAMGTFVTSTGITPGTNRLEIATDKGTLLIDKGTLVVKELEMKEQDFSASNSAFGVFGLPKYTTATYGFDSLDLPAHSLVINAFAGAILRDEPMIAEGCEGINSLTLSNAMYLSSWTDKTIKLPIDEDAFYAELQKRIKTSKLKNVASVVSDTAGSFLKK